MINTGWTGTIDYVNTYQDEKQITAVVTIETIEKITFDKLADLNRLIIC